MANYIATHPYYFFYAKQVVLFNGNGLFSDQNDTVLLLTDGLFTHSEGGSGGAIERIPVGTRSPLPLYIQD